jgi:hypothetical protein
MVCTSGPAFSDQQQTRDKFDPTDPLNSSSEVLSILSISSFASFASRSLRPLRLNTLFNTCSILDFCFNSTKLPQPSKVASISSIDIPFLKNIAENIAGGRCTVQSRKSKVESRKSKVKNQKSEVRIQRFGIWNLESGIRLWALDFRLWTFFRNSRYTPISRL